MNTIMIEFIVPTEAIPALIGYQGQKHKDTENRTSTKIRFLKNCDVLSTVRIIGHPDKCKIAEAILKMALGHTLASMTTSRPHNEVLNISHAKYDVKTFLFEVDRNKSLK